MEDFYKKEWKKPDTTKLQHATELIEVVKAVAQTCKTQADVLKSPEVSKRWYHDMYALSDMRVWERILLTWKEMFRVPVQLGTPHGH